jgi:hypothetical protein
MYTDTVVPFRLFALALALLVAATPVIGVVCAMDCERPPAASPACHDSMVPDDGTMLRAAPHACDHGQTGDPALLTNDSTRDSVGNSVAPATPTRALAILFEAHAAAADLMHGPPGVRSRSTSVHITILRV